MTNKRLISHDGVGRLRRWVLLLWAIPPLAWVALYAFSGLSAGIFGGALIMPLSPKGDLENGIPFWFTSYLFLFPSCAAIGTLILWFADRRWGLSFLAGLLYLSGAVWCGVLLGHWLGFSAPPFQAFGIFTHLLDWPFWLSWSAVTFGPPLVGLIGFYLLGGFAMLASPAAESTARLTVPLTREEIRGRLVRRAIALKPAGDLTCRVHLVSGEPMAENALYGLDTDAIQIGESVPYFLRIVSRKTPDTFTFRRLPPGHSLVQGRIEISDGEVVVAIARPGKETWFLPENRTLRREVRFWQSWLEAAVD